MKIFVTGGTGFIGSHFLNQAISKGYEVLALRRSAESIPRIFLKKDPIWLDKTLEEVSANDLKGCKVLVHLAAHSANVPYDTLENCIQANVIDPIGLFRKAEVAGVEKFIVAGSCFEYGRSGERYENIPVDAPLEPTSSYPASKAAASIAFYSLACELNLRLLVLRIFQVYGEGESEARFWPSLRRAALSGEDMQMTSGQQVRDFVSVSDVAARFVESIECDDLIQGLPRYENLGSGIPKTLADFAKTEWANFSAKGKLQLGKVPQRNGEVMRFVPETIRK